MVGEHAYPEKLLSRLEPRRPRPDFRDKFGPRCPTYLNRRNALRFYTRVLMNSTNPGGKPAISNSRWGSTGRRLPSGASYHLQEGLLRVKCLLNPDFKLQRTILVTQTTCTLEGSATCTISVKLLPNSIQISGLTSQKSEQRSSLVHLLPVVICTSGRLH
jgi:hypothetical protein